MSDHILSTYTVQKTQAFDVFMSYANAYNTEFDEDIEDVNVQTIERNFLKLFGILL